MSFFETNRLIFGGMLLTLIAVGEVVLHELHLPSWPVFFVMVFFFLSHMDRMMIPRIIIGAIAGIACMLIARPVVVALAPFIGAPLGRLLYILAVVAAIILFKDHVSMVFNDYCFAYFLISGMATKVSRAPNDPYIWIAVTLVGGTILVYSIMGMRKITEILARKRAVEAARKKARTAMQQSSL
jgi:hypothetical protein